MEDLQVIIIQIHQFNFKIIMKNNLKILLHIIKLLYHPYPKIMEIDHIMVNVIMILIINLLYLNL